MNHPFLRVYKYFHYFTGLLFIGRNILASHFLFTICCPCFFQFWQCQMCEYEENGRGSQHCEMCFTEKGVTVSNDVKKLDRARVVFEIISFWQII